MSLLTACIGRRAPEDKRPRATLPIHDVPVQSLFDSGSDATCLAWRKFCLMKDRPRLRPYPNRLTAANGEDLEIAGVADLRYKIGRKVITWGTIVVRNLKSESIIGVDLMHHHDICINMGKRLISVGEEKGGSLKIDPTIGQSSREYRINSCEAARIELSTVEAPGTPLLARGPFIEEGVCEVNHQGKASVLLTNRLLEPIVVRRKAPLCRFEPISREACRTPLTAQNGPTCTVSTIQKGIPDHLSNEILTPIMKNIPPQFKPRFAEMLRKYSAAFSRTDDEIGNCPIMPQKIELLDPTKITAKPAYRTPDALRPVAEEYVKKLVAQGVLESSRSPFASPLLIVKKPGYDDPTLPVFQRYRAVVDYRDLNTNVKKDRYPLPDTDVLIDYVASGKILTSIDVSAGFFSQRLEESSKECTAFSLKGSGHWHFTRSPMGICNSPSAFSRMMSYILRDVKDVEVFVDDIVLVSDDFESHLKTLEEVLKRFCKFNLKIRVNKMQLAADEIRYLGYVVSKDKGIRPGEAKTQAIRDWKPPTDVRQIKQFMGLCGYFRRVVKDFATIAKPLTVLTRKDSTYTKGPLPDSGLAAFKQLQRILSTRPTLAAVSRSPDYTFVLITDASNAGAGAILAQRGPDGLERPVAYASKTWTDSEARRATFHQEAAALLFGARRFRHYLLGRSVIFRVDHRPLVSLDKSSSPVLDRIYAELAEYDFKMEHIKGELMPADGLSRSALEEVGQRPPRPGPRSFDTSPCEGLKVDRLIGLQKRDRLIKALLCKLRYNLDPEAPHLAEFVNQHLPHAVVEEGVLGLRREGRFQILAPLEIRPTLLSISHDQPLGGHQGADKTTARLEQSWYWPGMRADIENYTKSCKICSENNTPPYHTVMPLRPLPEARYVGERVHVDLVGPYPSDVHGNRYACVMVDAFSNFVRIAPQPTKETEVTALSILNHWVCNHSVMTRIQSDHGGEFVSNVMRHLNQKLGVYRHVLSSPYHPQSNSKVERMNRELLSYIRKFLEGNGDKWSELLPALTFSLNTGLHKGKQMSAHQIVYKSRPTLPTDLPNPRINYSEVPFEQMLQRHHQIQDAVRQRQQAAFAAQKKAFDKTCKQRDFAPGMIVYVRRPKTGLRHQKFQPLYSGAYVIDSALGQDNFKLRHTESGKTLISHANRLKYGTAREQIIRHNDPDTIEEGERESQTSDDEEALPGEESERDGRTPSPPPSLPEAAPAKPPPPLPPPPPTIPATAPRRSARLQGKNKLYTNALSLCPAEWPPLHSFPPIR